MKRDSFVFYRSFFTATQYLKSERKAALFDAICAYALDGESRDLDNICTGMFSLIKPQLEANYKKWENGKKGAEFGKLGGRPKTPKKPLTNPKRTPNVNVNVNTHTTFNHLSITKDNYNKLVDIYSKDKVDSILEQIENYAGNKKYKNLYLTAKAWLKRDKDGKQEKKRASDFNAKRTFGISL